MTSALSSAGSLVDHEPPAKFEDKKLEAILQGKLTEYVGKCRMDKDGKLTFDVEKTVVSIDCLVGADPKTINDKFVLLFDKGMPKALIKATLADKKGIVKQSVIWKLATPAKSPKPTGKQVTV